MTSSPNDALYYAFRLEGGRFSPHVRNRSIYATAKGAEVVVDLVKEVPDNERDLADPSTSPSVRTTTATGYEYLGVVVQWLRPVQ